MVKCQQATASDLPFYDMFAHQRVSLLKISDDVIDCVLGPSHNQRTWLRLCFHELCKQLCGDHVAIKRGSDGTIYVATLLPRNQKWAFAPQ